MNIKEISILGLIASYLTAYGKNVGKHTISGNTINEIAYQYEMQNNVFISVTNDDIKWVESIDKNFKKVTTTDNYNIVYNLETLSQLSSYIDADLVTFLINNKF